MKSCFIVHYLLESVVCHCCFVQTSFRQRQAYNRAQSGSKQVADEKYAARMIQNQIRRLLVQTSYTGKRVQQAVQRFKIRTTLRRKVDTIGNRIEPPPPSEPALSSAMNYWMQTLGENKHRLDGLDTDMKGLQVSHLGSNAQILPVKH